MKKTFSLKNSPFPPRIAGLLMRFNLQRISMCCALILALQLCLSLDLNAAKSPLYIVGAILLTLVGALFGGTALVLKKKASLQYAQRLCFTFWILFVVSMCIFSLGDLANARPPINMIFCAFSLIALPVVRFWEDAWLFCLFAAGALGGCFYYHMPLFYFVIVLVLAFGGLFMARRIQNQYLALLAQLSTESTTDFLTGLLNRKGGMDETQQLMAFCQRQRIAMAVCMMDIDFFKNFNDQYGHLEGDEALRKVADCARKCFSRATDVVCRFGGEEFLICFPVDSPEGFAHQPEVFRREIEALAVPAAGNSASKFLTISIGVSGTFFGPGISSVHDLVANADAALYKAKSAGRNRVCFDPALSAACPKLEEQGL